MKARRASKTYWFNAVMAALTVAEAKLVLLQPVLGVEVYSYISFALIVGNVILRELTKEPVG